MPDKDLAKPQILHPPETTTATIMGTNHHAARSRHLLSAIFRSSAPPRLKPTRRPIHAPASLLVCISAEG